MPKFVIEREIPGVGGSGPEALEAIARKSNLVLQGLGPSIQWLHSYFVDNKTYCVYVAPSEALIREHARLSGFPANRISEVKAIVDPTTAKR